MSKHSLRRLIGTTLAASVALVVLAPAIAGAIVPAGAGTATGPVPVNNTLGQVTGPTADIATVANHLSYQAKSVTTVISAPAGLGLYRPVTISVGYGVTNADGINRITQDYNPATGTRLVFNFPAGDQLAHQQNIWVTLSQSTPRGGVYTWANEWAPTITPLYDVTLSPLTFQLLDDCEIVGNSNIELNWTNPTSSATADFSLGQFDSVTFPQFAGTWSQVSATSKLSQPGFQFTDTGSWYSHLIDWFPGTTFLPGSVSQTPVTLVPGTTSTASMVLTTNSGNPQECHAQISFHETYTLDTYPNL